MNPSMSASSPLISNTSQPFPKSSIYRQFLEDASRMLLTEVDKAEPTADVYFPQFAKEEWESTVLKENEDNGIKYKHLEYRRK